MTNNKLTNEHSCNCHSYNWAEGEEPNIILTVPENIRWSTDGRDTVCIDACIADAIKSLWEMGLPTINSCCGHNRENPALIIPEGCEPSSYLDALSRIDSREWVVSRWERVDYRRQHSLTEAECTKLLATASQAPVFIPSKAVKIPVLPDYVFHTMAVRWPLSAEQIKRLCRELQLEMEKHAGQSHEPA